MAAFAACQTANDRAKLAAKIRKAVRKIDRAINCMTGSLRWVWPQRGRTAAAPRGINDEWPHAVAGGSARGRTAEDVPPGLLFPIIAMKR
ncbi:hypothetical protein GCM10027431_19080 [Lysobacter rhizosphaerae]